MWFSWIPVLLLGWLSGPSRDLPAPDSSAPALWISGRNLTISDTFSFRWNGLAIGKAYPTATLHVWADHLESGRRWKFRYPVLNGVAEGDLAMAGSLPAGTYALNFMASDQFFEVDGRVKKVRIRTALNHKTRKRDTIIVYEYPKLTGGAMDYYLLGKEGVLHEGVLAIGPEGEFHVPRIVFGDSAQLVFNPGKGKGTYWIDIHTPLDSSFTPFFSETVFVQLNPSTDSALPWSPDTASYAFSFTDPRFVDMLPEIKVKGKTNAQKFEGDYVTGMFRDYPGVSTFEGLDSDDILRSGDIFTYLRNNVAGLLPQGSGMSRSFMWRGSPVQFFLNEFPVTPDAIATVSPMDVALIKAYPPPAPLGALSSGGAIGIYTKRGAYEKDIGGPKYFFMVRGFTQGQTRWGE